MRAPLNVHAINFAWLLRLRWGAIAGQVALVLIVDRVFEIVLPLAPICALVGAELASNIAAALRARGSRPIHEWMVGLLMAADVGFLTGLLYLPGGSSNPFSFLYLVYIALAAVVLRPRWTWGLTVLAIGCGGVLFRGHASHPLHGADMQLHLEVEVTLAAAPDRERVQVVVAPGSGEQLLQVPARAVVRALHALIDNARQAAPPPTPILVQVSSDANGCRIAVADRGDGMGSDILARAGEPFFSTRGPGKGMGLGLFLTRTLFDSLGGQLELVSTLGVGTTASVYLPAAPPATPRRAAAVANANAA